MSFLDKLRTVFTTSVPDTSEPGKLNSTDYAKLVRDFLIISAAAGLTHLSMNLHLIDLGQYTNVLIPILTFAISGSLKWLKTNSPTQ